jgi:BON domain-containing protein
MNHRDETIREKLTGLTAAFVDARNLAIEVETGRIVVSGSVPSEEQRDRAIEALAEAHDIEIFVRPVAPVDPGGGLTETKEAT